MLALPFAQAPFAVSHCELKAKCPAFKGGACPYSTLPQQMKGVAGKCPAFKGGCPWKHCTTVGEYLEIMSKMRDTCKGKAAQKTFFDKVMKVSKAGQAKLGACPFNKHKCQLMTDAHGKAIIPKWSTHGVHLEKRFALHAVLRNRKSLFRYGSHCCLFSCNQCTMNKQNLHLEAWVGVFCQPIFKPENTVGDSDLAA